MTATTALTSPAIAQTVLKTVTGTTEETMIFLDRSNPVSADLVRRLVEAASLNFHSRRPSLVQEPDGTFVTDLDLLSYLSALASRRSMIEIPEYTGYRQKTIRRDERRIGTTRFGNITRLVSNRYGLSFSVQILDRSVAVTRDLFESGETETAGAHRTYMVVDGSGNWHAGWKQLGIKPSTAEHELITRRGIAHDGTITFSHAVHPNRRQSIFGAPYLTLKMLLIRLRDELAFYRKEVKRLRALGIAPIASETLRAPSVREGSTKKTRVGSIVFELDMPRLTGAYSHVIDNRFGMEQAATRIHELMYTLIPLVQFVVRADEAAYYWYGMEHNFVASWMGTATWEHGVRPKGRRRTWSVFTLTDDVRLRYRTFMRTEMIRA